MKIYIEGTIRIIDDEQEEEVKFSISNYEGWSQWDAVDSILWKTMPVVQKLNQSLNDEFIYYEDEEE